MEALLFFLTFLPFIIFFSGMSGVVLWHKNLVLIIVALEISFISSNVGFILSSLYLDDILGYVFSLTSLTLAGAEVSVGLALAIVVFRKFDNIYIKDLQNLKG